VRTTSIHATHSEERVSALALHLEKCGAPGALIDDFRELVAIDNNMSLASHLGTNETEHILESLDRLLLDSCRNFNFPLPFKGKEDQAYFRPSDLLGYHSEYRKDGRLWGSNFNPEVEQAYRRGYCHGFKEATTSAKIQKLSWVAKRLKELLDWRHAPVWFGVSEPGTYEPFGVEFGGKRSVSTRLRFSILERDGRKCVVCGQGATDGVRLHVDHILSVYNGGSNDPSNLQTLCELCNLGKGKD
jgi:hypothetical protein